MTAASFAVLATVCWALTPAFINEGLASVPDDRRAGELLGYLTLSLLLGLLLAVLALWGSVWTSNLELVLSHPAAVYAALAGLFLFPVHNGLYYVTAHAYRRSEVVLQFEQLSPVVTVPLGFAVGEAVTLGRLAAFALVVAGSATLFWITARGNLGVTPFVLGMAFMVSGSIGGFLGRLAIDGLVPLLAIALALAAGAAVQLVVLAVARARLDIDLRRTAGRWRRSVGFPGHGVLSFGLAYPAYFLSLERVGLSSTSLVVVSSPIVALAFILPARALFDRSFLGEPSVISDAHLLAASVVVFAGSLIIVVT